VATLSPGTPAQRHALFESARAALLRQLRSLDPPWSGAEIAAELWALEQAITRIEGNRNPPAAVEEPASSKQDGTAAAVRSAKTGRGARIARIAICVVMGSLAFLASFLLARDMTQADPVRMLAMIPTLFPTYFVVLAGLPLWIVSIVRRRQRLREAGLRKRRIRQFAWKRYDERTRVELARSLDDRALMWAYFLPDHKPAAKDVIAQELVRRGYSRSDVEGWTPDACDFTVPPASERPMSAAWYSRLSRQKAVWFNILRGCVILIIVVLPVMIALGLLYQTFRPQWFEPFANVLTSQGGKSDNDPLSMAFLVLFLFCLGSVWLAGFLYRNRAARILLLRPFGEKRMTRGLKRFVPRHLGTSGYVFTLSDRNYKPSVILAALVHIPVQGVDAIATIILGPLLRNSTRIASVRNERRYRKLQKFLMRKFRPSSWSFICGGQSFNIRSTDPWWQLCIHMLMHTCEAIVIDLSKVKEGTAWELNQLQSKRILNKCVFVVGENNVADVPPVLARYFPGGAWPTVHVYANNGKLADKRLFDTAFDRIVAAGVAGWGR
jgi:hypothetical protein